MLSRLYPNMQKHLGPIGSKLSAVLAGSLLVAQCRAFMPAIIRDVRSSPLCRSAVETMLNDADAAKEDGAEEDLT